jgi:hypothetical protein
MVACRNGLAFLLVAGLLEMPRPADPSRKVGDLVEDGFDVKEGGTHIDGDADLGRAVTLDVMKMRMPGDLGVFA